MEGKTPSIRLLYQLKDIKRWGSFLARIGSLRLISYKRIGRVYSVEVLRKLYEEYEDAYKGKDKD